MLALQLYVSQLTLTTKVICPHQIAAKKFRPPFSYHFTKIGCS
jgi:hypothetical protein